MVHPTHSELPKFVLSTLNHLYEIERKLALHGDPASIQRNVERIKETFADANVFYEDPMGQPFSETRIDLEASISGEGTDELVVTEVIKPIVRIGDKDYSRVVQKGIVVVKSKAQGEFQ
ncbi:hypothetical protein PQR57_13570 [Paraburkholderia dipogonis]|uniref:Nucleotide exchange factor GrpE n=1 Tax=Paraburkholderia dipogonis TaxID=1211383 RepID=A0ABW9AN91_9BURK